VPAKLHPFFFSLLLPVWIRPTACTQQASSPSRQASSHPSAAHPSVPRRFVARTTAYSHREKEPGAYKNYGATGNKLRYYGPVRSAAADWSRLPLGTRFRIAGQPVVYEIDDYGTALVGTDTIDLYTPNLRLMKEWGVREVEVEILQWGSFERSSELLAQRTHYPHCRMMYNQIQRRCRL